MIKPLAKSVLIPLGLTAAASAADTGIHKRILGSGNTTLIVSNNEIEDIIKIIKPLENSGLLLKGVTETVQNELRDQKGVFLVCYILVCYFLTGREINTAGKGRGINRECEGVFRAGYGNHCSKMDF